MKRIKTYSAKAPEIKAHWQVFDASEQVLGRMATRIALILQGKHKVIYTAHELTGDYVVVINASRVRITGQKLDQKMYYRHSGYHGGLTEQTLATVLKKHPTRVLRGAIKGMLPKNTLGRKMLSRLKVYSGERHPHEAQVRGITKLKEPSGENGKKES